VDEEVNREKTGEADRMNLEVEKVGFEPGVKE